MDAIEQTMDAVIDHLGTAAQSGAVSGTPIQVGDLTLVVLSTISVGMGAAGGQGEGESAPGGPPGGGSGEGAGGGAKVRPAAVIAFGPNSVDVLPVPAPPGTIDHFMDRVPQLLELVDKVRTAFGVDGEPTAKA